MMWDQVACGKTQAIKIQFMLFVQFLHSATMEKKMFLNTLNSKKQIRSRHVCGKIIGDQHKKMQMIFLVF